MTQLPQGGPPPGPHGAPRAQAPAAPQAPTARRRGPWIALAVGVLVCTLVGGVALGVGAVWFLDPFGRSSPRAGAAGETASAPALATGGTADYSFTYPTGWVTQQPTETASENEVYFLEARSADGVELLRVWETEVLDDPIAFCWNQAEEQGYTLQDDIELDGRVAKHLQNRTPADSGRPRIRDAWCARTASGTAMIIIGSTISEDAGSRESSSAQQVVDSWSWSD